MTDIKNGAESKRPRGRPPLPPLPEDPTRLDIPTTIALGDRAAAGKVSANRRLKWALERVRLVEKMNQQNEAELPTAQEKIAALEKQIDVLQRQLVAAESRGSFYESQWKKLDAELLNLKRGTSAA